VIVLPPLWRAVAVTAVLSLFGVLRPLSRLMDRWLDSPAEPTAAEIACAARLTRLYRLRVQPTEPTAGVGASPTPAPAVSHMHHGDEVFRGADQ
jgi:hypothetical protein